MKVPIPKRPDWFLDEMTKRIENGYNKIDVHKLAQDFSLSHLAKQDLLEEFYNMKTFLKATPMPMVFCHGDFRNSNIMVTSDQGGRESIVVCDFEEFSYGRRATDMGTFFSNWNVDGFKMSMWQMPNDRDLTHFVQAYLEQWDQLQPGYSSQAGNSVENIVHEAKIATMVNFLFLAAFFSDFENTGIEVAFDLEKKWVC